MGLELMDQPHRPANVISIDVDAECILCGERGSAGANGFCLKCAAMAAGFKIPKEHEFEDADFILAPELAEIGRKLIKRYEDFQSVAFAEFTYLWKLKGGKTGKKNKLGACQKPTGLLKHFAETDFIIWCAADNCARAGFYEMTALVFHELKHAGYNPENGNYELVPHDFEGFNREIEVFGAWKSDVHSLERAFKSARQPGLFE